MSFIITLSLYAGAYLTEVFRAGLLNIPKGLREAGLAIGLTLAAIHLVGINVTGVSVNPARSIGPALFSGGSALTQLWVFIVAPLVGGLLAGALYKAGITRAD